MRKEDIDYSVYLVTDRRNKTDEEFLNIIEEAIKGGTTIVQLREKTASTKEFYELALRVKEITSRYGVPLLINDRIDIALAVDSEGVHIGQDDMPADIAREIIGDDKILGVSASTVEEAKKAERDSEDYKRHSLLDIVTPSETYSVKQYQEDFRKQYLEYKKTYNNIIVCGGTGLYIKAALYDYRFEDEEEADVSDLENMDNEELYCLLKK
ncbi:MAG: thiamine phosphate synthase, partial [Methanobrevibacter sp.]|nr:thiamine phosphate synthase [Methanobrevibacter sp.]